MQMPNSYRHTQTGTLSLAIIVPALALIAAIGMQTGWPAVVVIVAVILLLCGVIFSSLTVEVRGDLLGIWFGPGLISKSFALRDIAGVEVVRNRWYYGWGIRWTPRGWLWNVSGLDAVELSLTSGKAFRIGTDRPEELAAALRQAIA